MKNILTYFKIPGYKIYILDNMMVSFRNDTVKLRGCIGLGFLVILKDFLIMKKSCGIQPRLFAI